MADGRLIEYDEFPFEFLSQLAEHESWRKELHRPIYHVHKWWANRLGSVFRGIILGSVLPRAADMRREFYREQSLSSWAVFDPFMGSGTTVGEAHKLGLTAFGRDINPVAVQSVSTALGPLNRRKLVDAVEQLSQTAGARIAELYRTRDSRGRRCCVLYFFWVMQVNCTACGNQVDLFSSYVVARNAAPKRHREIQILCPSCGIIFQGVRGVQSVDCPACARQFNPTAGTTDGARACCTHCARQFRVIDAIAPGNGPPSFRLYGKLVLTLDGTKEYLPATADDQSAYRACSEALRHELEDGRIRLPHLRLAHGYNTRQAMNYGFTSWRDFFNDRQLLALGWLRAAIEQLPDEDVRGPLLTLFSGVLEFNNLFASYKGEGTGAVRHMFSHHILKPERMPIEANVWGTRKSSGSFSTLFRSRLLRAIDYKENPTEIGSGRATTQVCSVPLMSVLEKSWPQCEPFITRGVYLSCGDSSDTGLPSASLDLVVTDPPFFDNVHYSELADFFFAWQQLSNSCSADAAASTRHPDEVQDTDAERFAQKLQAVFRECHRVLRDDGLLVFTYHHSRNEGWRALAEAILGAKFLVVNTHPIKAEMSVATPKFQAKEPIQLDIIIVCRKFSNGRNVTARIDDAINAAKAKLDRLREEGIALSRNDKKIVIYGQALTSLSDISDLAAMCARVDVEFASMQSEQPGSRCKSTQRLLFDE